MHISGARKCPRINQREAPVVAGRCEKRAAADSDVAAAASYKLAYGRPAPGTKSSGLLFATSAWNNENGE
ncbi:MAG TPA: hypothetical protein VNH11_33385 [Pirellulales bacterium]|nr:hypothetical protein [Pirellulales bacterium]